MGLSLGIILLSLVGRALSDKYIAFAGGPTLIAQWYQIQSVSDVIAGIALAGIAPGISVLVAQEKNLIEQRRYLWSGLLLGLGLGLCMLVILLLLAVTGIASQQPVISVMVATPIYGFLALVAGWLSIVPGTLGAFFTGTQARHRLLGMTVLQSTASVVVVLSVPSAYLLTSLLLVNGVFGILVLIFILYSNVKECHPDLPEHAHLIDTASFSLPMVSSLGVFVPMQSLRAYVHKLVPFILPSIVIGICSPLSLLVSREIMADRLSTDDVGAIQSVWRTSEWVGAIVYGILSLYWFPLLARAENSLQLWSLLRRMILNLILPAWLVLLLMTWYSLSLISFFYTDEFALPSNDVLWFWMGDGVRLLSWVFLYALYVRHASRLIALGEWLSLPLFATILFLLPDLTRGYAGMAWLGTFIVYAAFNILAFRYTLKKDTPVSLSSGASQ